MTHNRIRQPLRPENALPGEPAIAATTLYDPSTERDACGIGFVADADGRASREIVDLLLEGLRRVRHRGATAADRRTGDGAGLLLPIPDVAARTPGCGLAMVFLRDESARSALEEACRDGRASSPCGWRRVPVAPDAPRRRGPREHAAHRAAPARAAARRDPTTEAERRAYRARRRARARGGRVRRLALVPHGHLQGALRRRPARRLLPRSRATATSPSRSAIFHQRFSTNTTPSWERAQPFRFLCHNGEINTIQGNVNWMRAREGNFGSADDELYHPVLDEAGSDSAMLDNALELLVRGGRDVRHALAMLVPPAWEGTRSSPDERARLLPLPRGSPRALGRPGRRSCSPTDASSAPRSTATALRPLRYAVCEDGLVVCCVRGGRRRARRPRRVRRGRLGPGQMIAVDPERGLEEDAQIKPLARRGGARTGAGSTKGSSAVLDRRRPSSRRTASSPRARRAYGYTREELTWSCGRSRRRRTSRPRRWATTRRCRRSPGRARPLFHYFRQRFAQVTNPPIDHLRERFVMSLRTRARRRAAASVVTAPEAAARHRARELLPVPASARRSSSPVAPRRDASTPTKGLRRAPASGSPTRPRPRCARAHGMLLVSDTAADGPPIPVAARDRAVHHRLVATGLRTLATLVVETRRGARGAPLRLPARLRGRGDLPAARARDARRARGGGQARRRPPLARGGAAALPHAIEDGVLKVMSKMGISDVASYCGAQIFEALGLAPRGRRALLPRHAVPIGGLRLRRARARAVARATAAPAATSDAREPRLREVAQGRRAARDEPRRRRRAARVVAAHALARRRARLAANGLDGWSAYEQFAALVDGRAPMEPRDLLELVPAGEPVPLDEVEPAEAIVARFSSGGDVARRALRRGARDDRRSRSTASAARANSGEGGEDPARFRDERNSPHQAGRVRPLRRHARVRRLRRRAPDQDRAGLEARRGRPAPRAQGHDRDRAPAPHRARRRAHLTAAAPRHLLDRGPRAAHLRPQAGEPGRGRLGQARLRERASASSLPAS